MQPPPYLKLVQNFPPCFLFLLTNKTAACVRFNQPLCRTNAYNSHDFFCLCHLNETLQTNCTLAMRHHTLVLSTYTGCLLILFITRLRNITIRPPALLSYELLSTLYQLEKKSFSCPCLFSLYHFNGCYISHCFNTLYQVLHIN